MAAVTPARREVLHRRGVRLEVFTITWNVVEAFVAIGAGLLAGSVALVGFGADSGVEVVSAVALLWRLLKAGPRASAEETGTAEKRALYLVAATFFLLSAYVAYEAVGALAARVGPDGSTVGLALAAVSLLVMPAVRWLTNHKNTSLGFRARISKDGERTRIEEIMVA